MPGNLIQGQALQSEFAAPAATVGVVSDGSGPEVGRELLSKLWDRATAGRCRRTGRLRAVSPFLDRWR